MEHKVPLASLLQVNPYVDVYNLQVGETICVPVKKGFGSTLPPAYDVPVEEDKGENIPEEEETVWEYTTRKGDTLEGVLGVESIPLMSGITIRIPRE
jgi:hypothetical protein